MSPQRRLTIRPQLGPGQQPEPLVEPVAHLDGAHGRHPRRGQLDAEGQSVERLADPDHCVRRLLVEDPEPGPYRTGPLGEQGHRVGRHAVHGQRGHGQQCLAGRAQVLPRGREDARDLGTGQHLSDGLRGRREHVLAVVDHDQHPTSGQCLGHGVDDPSTALRGDAKGRGDRVGDRVGVAHGCQLDQPHAVRELLRELHADRQGEPRLPDASHPAQGHQRPGTDQGGHLGQGSRSPDESGRGARQVPAAALHVHQISLASTSSPAQDRRRLSSRPGSRDRGAWLNQPSDEGEWAMDRLALLTHAEGQLNSVIHGSTRRRWTSSRTARRGRSAAWPATP